MGKISSRFLNKGGSYAITTLAAVVLAIFTGCLLRLTEQWSQRSLKYLAFPGEIFIRSLQCLVLPLIVSTLICTLGNAKKPYSCKIGRHAIVYILSTSALASILGIFLASIIGPGSKLDVASISVKNIKPNVTSVDGILDVIRNIFPDNVVEVATSRYETKLKQLDPNESDLYKWDITASKSNSANALGIIAISIVVGITLGKIGQSGKALLKLSTSVRDVSTSIAAVITKFSPIAIFFLITAKIVSHDVTVINLHYFMTTVILGLFIHGLVVLPIIFNIYTSQNPFSYICSMSSVLATAFGTSSSLATLPITISQLLAKGKVKEEVATFFAPLGAVLNLNGTTLFQAVAVIFFAQLRGVHLGLSNLMLVVIVSTIVTIGSAGLPYSGVMGLMMMLGSVGLSADDIFIIISVDWLLNMLRTTVNVLGDLYGAGILGHMNKEEFTEDNSEIKDINMLSNKNDIKLELANITA